MVLSRSGSPTGRRNDTGIGAWPRPRPVWRRGLQTGLVAALLLGAWPAGAVSFGPLAVVPPSAASPESGPPQTLTGTLALDVASLPVAGPTLLSLLDVSVTGGGASFALDPTVTTPGIGALQPDGSFLLPTLFLRVTSGPDVFDLAIPNVTGTLSFGPGGTSVVGLESSFAIDSGGPAGRIAVRIVAAVPEPGTALLLAAGLAGLAARTRAGRAR
jgi:hypothetical protein